MTKKERLAVIGYGPVGKLVVDRLTKQNRSVRVIQRTRPSDLPTDAEFESTDALDQDALLHAVGGCSAIVCTLGFPYEARVCHARWEAWGV
jgi:Trk K+ transport system NAD-binding subunit